MKKIIGCILYLGLCNSVLAAEQEAIVKNVQDVCLTPSKAGKYWNVTARGEAGADTTFRLLNAALKGEATFTKGEWEGVQQVLKDQQHADNADYRDCVKKLTPLFLSKFSDVSSESKSVDIDQSRASEPSQIRQETKGDKSPAIISNGKTIINY